MAVATTFASPLEVRLACRANELSGFASRALPGYLCVNVVFLDQTYAEDFEQFCQLNPKPCPLLKRKNFYAITCLDGSD